MSHKSRFIVGIDLGTTHCALSYFDRYDPSAGIQSFAILQWEDDGSVVKKTSLPSFLYLLTKSEVKRQDKRISLHPEDETVVALVGREARQRLSRQPERVIHSAKSWLCHGGVNRSAKILPWQSSEILGDQRWSPLEVSAELLRYLRLAWDDYFKGHDSDRLAEQEVLVTVPASFDEAAQRLTLQACQLAGLGTSVRLLEEPQAAFFDWLSVDLNQLDRIDLLFQKLGRKQARVLVCDVGGGTSDFSILELTKDSETMPRVKRHKVSRHILLGGDNIDLAIAHRIEQQRSQGQDLLRAGAWTQLIDQARRLKESLLSLDFDLGSMGDLGDYFVTIDQGGSSLFESAETIAVDQKAIAELILDGFFPMCDRLDRPREEPRSGLSEWGLPYAGDSAVTRYLAGFLQGEEIDAVLFAGGSLNPQILRHRLRDLLERWQERDIIELEASSLDLAVARGAAAYACLDEKYQGLISTSYPRSVFLKVHHSGQDKFLRLMPRGSPFSQTWAITDLRLLARINQRVEFEVYTDEEDVGAPGELLEPSLTFHQLPPMQTILHDPARKQGQIEVELRASVGETGLLQLACVDKKNPEQSWSLDFHTKDSGLAREQAACGQNPGGQAISKAKLQEMQDLVAQVYGKKKPARGGQLPAPQDLLLNLEKAAGSDKGEWNIPQLRQVFDLIIGGLTRRQRSEEHEASWLYLAGYCLRPGFGALRDPDRCAELWRAWELGLAHPKNSRALDQWWIMWRRIAGGLNQEQQNSIFDRIIPQVRKLNSEQVSREMILLAGALERVEMNRKLQLGRSLAAHLKSGQKQLVDAKIWALARLASRIPFHGGDEDVIQANFIEEWIEELSAVDIRQKHYKSLIYFYSQAARLMNVRELDLSQSYRERCLAQLERARADEALKKPLLEYCPADHQYLAQLFGEDLPTGIEFSEAPEYSSSS